MKKYHRRIVLVIWASLFNLNAIAAITPGVCPPIATILAHSELIKAGHVNYLPHIWIFDTAKFEYEGRRWGIFYTAALPNIHTAEEALKAVNYNFKNRVKLLEPQLMKSYFGDGEITCSYGNYYEADSVEAYLDEMK